MDFFRGVRYLTIEAGAGWRITGPVGAFPATGSLREDKDILDGVIGVREGRWEKNREEKLSEPAAR